MRTENSPGLRAAPRSARLSGLHTRESHSRTQQGPATPLPVLSSCGSSPWRVSREPGALEARGAAGGRRPPSCFHTERCQQHQGFRASLATRQARRQAFGGCGFRTGSSRGEARRKHLLQRHQAAFTPLDKKQETRFLVEKERKGEETGAPHGAHPMSTPVPLSLRDAPAFTRPSVAKSHGAKSRSRP